MFSVLRPFVWLKVTGRDFDRLKLTKCRGLEEAAPGVPRDLTCHTSNTDLQSNLNYPLKILIRSILSGGGIYRFGIGKKIMRFA